MKILRHLALHATPDQLAEIDSLGISPRVVPNTTLPGDTRPPLVEFFVDDTSAIGQAIGVLMEKWGESLGYVKTEFTEREIESARWLQLGAWNNGFPQPQTLEGYTRVTYDLSHWCDKCSYGTVQNAPFRIKGEPKWNRRGIMTLIWVHDEFFVPPAIWETVFKPFSIACRPVANAKGVELKTVVQLVVDEEVDIVTEGLKELPCDGCHRIRYEWPVRGMFPRFVHEPQGAMAKSRQALGHGWSIRAVFIAQELARALKAHNVRGAEFTPVDAALPALVA